MSESEHVHDEGPREHQVPAMILSAASYWLTASPSSLSEALHGGGDGSQIRALGAAGGVD